MRYGNIIFDLDGTLVDSLAGIEASSRHAVNQCFPAKSLPPMRELIGPPIAKMFARLWPELNASELETLVASFRQHYNAEGCFLSELYPGVRETLRTLQEYGATMFVLTNKPRHATGLILEHLRVLSCFTALVSPDSQEPAFTAKREGAKLLREKYDLDPAATVLVGDGRDDAEAAEASGFSFLIAAYGYGSAAREAHGMHTPAVKTFPSILEVVL